MDGIKVFASNDALQQGGVLSFVSDTLSPELIANALGVEKIAVRSGFHCSPIAHESAETAEGTVRVSVSDFTDENDIYGFIKNLKEIL
jgi:selenocysteine lyase/cysteine desulfurase